MLSKICSLKSPISSAVLFSTPTKQTRIRGGGSSSGPVETCCMCEGETSCRESSFTTASSMSGRNVSWPAAWLPTICCSPGSITRAYCFPRQPAESAATTKLKIKARRTEGQSMGILSDKHPQDDYLIHRPPGRADRTAARGGSIDRLSPAGEAKPLLAVLAERNDRKIEDRNTRFLLPDLPVIHFPVSQKRVAEYGRGSVCGCSPVMS